MSHLSRYIGKLVLGAIFLVLFVIISLDFVSMLIDEMDRLKAAYTIKEAIIYTALYIPSSFYEYLPLSALVGCMIGLGVLASANELTVIRAAGVSIRQLVWIVFKPILFVVFLGTVMGEYIAPYTDQYADSRRALARGHTVALDSEKGLWNKEGNIYMHINAVLPNGKVFGMTRYEFADDGSLETASFIDSAIYQGDHWYEQDVEVTRFDGAEIDTEYFSGRRWYSELSPELLNVLVFDPDELPIRRLNDYAIYLEKQDRDSSDYRLAFWQKTLQPLATLSLVVIALSFVLGPLRQVTMGFRVFVGVIIGLIFQTSQKLLGPTSIIMGFAPIYAVLIPILFCFFFGWVLLKKAE